MQRTRTTTWEDPLATHAASNGLSGLEYLSKIASGELPPAPIARTMGFDMAEVSEGKAMFSATPGEWVYNPIGVVHGGFALTLLDSVMGCAVHTTLPAGVAYTSLEVKSNFVRAISADTGLVKAYGEVIHVGGRIATASGRIEQASTGKLLAHGTTTCLIMRP